MDISANLSKFDCFISKQMQAQEQIETCLRGLEALTTVATAADRFYDLPDRILHGYFLVMSDLIEDAIKANQDSMNGLFLSDSRSENEAL